LDHARGELFKVWAAGDSVDFPGYGLTAILDTDGATLPPRIKATVASIDAGSLRRAALATAERLTVAVERVAPMLADAGLTPPDGLRTWVLRRLAG
jgi:hypothetical protein